MSLLFSVIFNSNEISALNKTELNGTAIRTSVFVPNAAYNVRVSEISLPNRLRVNQKENVTYESDETCVSEQLSHSHKYTNIYIHTQTH